MDADLVLIFGFILAVIMLVLPFAYIVNQRVQGHEERKLELKARAEEAKAEQLRFSNGDYSKMEERVRELERQAAQLAAEQRANGTPQLPPVPENPATPTGYEPS